MTTKVHGYFIDCITNLHVGSGDANYGVVDKLVQRDPVTGLPTIHSSSMKGALREHFEKKWTKDDPRISEIFGKEDRENSASGDYSFLGADLIAMPVRCNYQQFVMTFSGKMTEVVNDKSEVLLKQKIFDLRHVSENKIYIPNHQAVAQSIFIEGDNLEKQTLPTAGIGKLPVGVKQKFAYIDDEKFKTYKLPVIARNYLENGISKNLWYEEVVPHKSVFITYILATDKYFNDFEKELTSATIQVGANASIGYGICKFSKIELQ